MSDALSVGFEALNGRKPAELSKEAPNGPPALLCSELSSELFSTAPGLDLSHLEQCIQPAFIPKVHSASSITARLKFSQCRTESSNKKPAKFGEWSMCERKEVLTRSPGSSGPGNLSAFQSTNLHTAFPESSSIEYAEGIRGSVRGFQTEPSIPFKIPLNFCLQPPKWRVKSWSSPVRLQLWHKERGQQVVSYPCWVKVQSSPCPCSFSWMSRAYKGDTVVTWLEYTIPPWTTGDHTMRITREALLTIIFFRTKNPLWRWNKIRWIIGRDFQNLSTIFWITKSVFGTCICCSIF